MTAVGSSLSASNQVPWDLEYWFFIEPWFLELLAHKPPQRIEGVIFLFQYDKMESDSKRICLWLRLQTAEFYISDVCRIGQVEVGPLLFTV